MDRDVALNLSNQLQNIKTALQTLSTNVTPQQPASRSVNNERSVTINELWDNPEPTKR